MHKDGSRKDGGEKGKRLFDRSIELFEENAAGR